MIDINKQIKHWLNGSDEDLIVEKELIGNIRIRHGLFFAHLAVEKVLKTHVCCHTNESCTSYPQSGKEA